jgi:hypothetical protein
MGGFCPKYYDDNLSEKFSAEMEFCKIEPSLKTSVKLFKCVRYLRTASQAF